MAASSANTSRLFRLLHEIIIAVLGVLLILLARTHRFARPSSTATWIIVGVFLIYWGARAGLRPSAGRAGATAKTFERLRGGSFILSGLLILSLAGMPERFAPLLLGVAGAVLALRGLLGALLHARPARPLRSRPGGP